MKTGHQTLAAALLSALMVSSVQAVEMMDESALGGIHINAGNVLNIVGPTAAGGDAPPIQQTAGEQASVSMALGLMATESNRPSRRVEDERNILSLVFPEPDFPVPRQRSIPSPASDGQTLIVINPPEYQVQSFIESVQGRPVVNTDFDVRVQEIQWQGVRFPKQAISRDGFNQTLYGLEFTGSGRMMRSLD
ncbi:hypothetical protein CK501_14875 [Halovibrio salipaludis]|uniref:Uncharacterized protein n=1 Tax=Halovibrio salipaludis TaxID=2032626 RepID=A0A2A2EX50_9GAMM|nr:hypothetical protein [Halovibrio salipaludis]PAU77736.1 hypothetical protein CK501_14875 [Halovibrio salipaludis]